MSIGEKFVHESLLGTTFIGTLRDVTAVGEHTAVLPSVSGRGWVTGYHQFVLDDDDPFPVGYTIGDIWGRQQAAERA